MYDKKLDLLYGLCFSQMIRLNISPTYVEKRILDETVKSIRNYILQFVEKLKNKIISEKNRNVDSYLTWDSEYYKKDFETKEKILLNFEKRIKETDSKIFLGEDFSLTKTDLDNLYPDILPKSLVRDILWNQCKNIKEKKN